MTLDIAAIKARADKATAGPWDWNSRHGLGAPNRLVMWPSHEYGCDLDIEGEEADLDFIANARTDIPALIAALEASEAARVKAEQEREKLSDDMEWYSQPEQARDAAEFKLISAQDRITALEQERDALKEALRHIVEMTDAENPESYRADDREGCLDTVHDTARRALEAKP